MTYIERYESRIKELEQELEKEKQNTKAYRNNFNESEEELERYQRIVKNTVSEKMYFYIKKEFEGDK